MDNYYYQNYRLKKLEVGKEHMPSAVERAMESMTSKARSVTSQLQRDRVLNTLSKLLLKQYEGLSQANRDLSGGLEDLNNFIVCEEWSDEGEGKGQGKRYKKAEFQAQFSKLEGIRCEGERVSLQLRQLTDVMEQSVFDLERNIHQQNLYLTLP